MSIGILSLSLNTTKHTSLQRWIQDFEGGGGSEDGYYEAANTSGRKAAAVGG